MTNTVIFACVHSAGRSQMSAAFFNALADPATRAIAVSAGTEPAERVHPEVVDVDARSGDRPRQAPSPMLLTDELARGATLLVTMGCGEACPLVPGLERADWDSARPEGSASRTVRAIRDDIRARVGELVRTRRVGADGRRDREAPCALYSASTMRREVRWRKRCCASTHDGIRRASERAARVTERRAASLRSTSFLRPLPRHHRRSARRRAAAARLERDLDRGGRRPELRRSAMRRPLPRTSTATVPSESHGPSWRTHA